MNEPLPPGIDSVAAEWVEGWALPIHEIPPPDFDAKVMARFDALDIELHQQMAGSSSVSMLSTLLKLCLRGEDAARVATIVRRLEGKADAVAESLRKLPGSCLDNGLDAHLRLAFAAKIAAPELPPAAELSQLGRWAVADLSKPRGALHAVTEQRLRMAAFGALLALDLDLLSRLIPLVPGKQRQASAQWALLERIVDVARLTGTADAARITIADELARREFIRLYAMERLPRYLPDTGRERPMDAPVILGNYYFSWTWLRVFAPEPTDRTDWTVMRRLMTG